MFESISKKLKRKVLPKEIAKIYNRFFFSDEGRTNESKYRTNIRVINIKDVSEKFKISEDQLLRIYESMGGKLDKNKKNKKFG